MFVNFDDFLKINIYLSAILNRRAVRKRDGEEKRLLHILTIHFPVLLWTHKNQVFPFQITNYKMPWKSLPFLMKIKLGKLATRVCFKLHDFFLFA